jgi:uncharacterized membrane protein
LVAQQGPFAWRDQWQVPSGSINGANLVQGKVTKLVRDVVIPCVKLFTILLAAFQASIALMILSRGSLVQPGLIAGAAFSLAVISVSNVSGSIANFALAAIQAFLAFTR